MLVLLLGLSIHCLKSVWPVDRPPRGGCKTATTPPVTSSWTKTNRRKFSNAAPANSWCQPTRTKRCATTATLRTLAPASTRVSGATSFFCVLRLRLGRIGFGCSLGVEMATWERGWCKLQICDVLACTGFVNEFCGAHLKRNYFDF